MAWHVPPLSPYPMSIQSSKKCLQPWSHPDGSVSPAPPAPAVASPAAAFAALFATQPAGRAPVCAPQGSFRLAARLPRLASPVRAALDTLTTSTGVPLSVCLSLRYHWCSRLYSSVITALAAPFVLIGAMAAALTRCLRIVFSCLSDTGSTFHEPILRLLLASFSFFSSVPSCTPPRRSSKQPPQPSPLRGSGPGGWLDVVSA